MPSNRFHLPAVSQIVADLMCRNLIFPSGLSRRSKSNVATKPLISTYFNHVCMESQQVSPATATPSNRHHKHAARPTTGVLDSSDLPQRRDTLGRCPKSMLGPHASNE